MPCGCFSSEACNCFVEAGDGIIVTGIGTAGNPFIVEATGGGGAGGDVCDNLEYSPPSVLDTIGDNLLRCNDSGELTILTNGPEYFAEPQVSTNIAPIGGANIFSRTFTNNDNVPVVVEISGALELQYFVSASGPRSRFQAQLEQTGTSAPVALPTGAQMTQIFMALSAGDFGAGFQVFDTKMIRYEFLLAAGDSLNTSYVLTTSANENFADVLLAWRPRVRWFTPRTQQIPGNLDIVVT